MAKWSLVSVRLVAVLSVAWFASPATEARAACGDHVAVLDPSARPDPGSPPSPSPCRGWWCSGVPAPAPAPAPASVAVAPERPDAWLASDWQFPGPGWSARAAEPNAALPTRFEARPERPPRG